MTYHIIFSDETMPKEITKSIFLAGPSPRSSDVYDWRHIALDILNFCKYCYIQNNAILVYVNIIIDIDDWIIKLTDDYYTVLDNKLKEELFKE